MKKTALAAICILLSVTMMAQPAFRRGAKKTSRTQYNIEEVVPVKTSGEIVKHLGFTVSYSDIMLIPNWVAYELTAEEASAKEVSRTDEFLPDPQIKGRQPDTRDYSNSGFDRGHMAAAADMKWSKQAMVESFYLSNTVPQNRDHNEPIGVNKVVVPDALFKCVCMQKDGRWTMAAFVFPNLPLTGDLTEYIFPVVGVEQKVGINVFNNVPVTPQELFYLKAIPTKEDWDIPGWKKQ